MKKNDVLIGKVISLGMNGEGIVKDNDIVVFIPFALPNEKIRYKILKVQKNIAFGKLIEVLEFSPFRIIPKCKYFGKCGGCQIQHLQYEQQLKLKEEKIKDCFLKIANIDIEVSKCETGDNEFRYRNKLQLPIISVDGETKIGFYAENSHRVVEIEDCLINAEWTKNLIDSVKGFITDNNIVGYDEQSGSGDIREITAREIDDKLIICLVSLKDELNNIDNFVKLLLKNISKEFSLFINVNKKNSNVIYGKDFKLVYGKESYSTVTHGIKHKIGVESFMQVNDSVCKKLYSSVKNLINSDENSVIIDAYSGAGLMTAMLSTDAKKAIGIEIIQEAVNLANELAKENNLDKKIINYCGKCEEILPDIIERETKNGNKVNLVLDPPRKGVDIKIIESIIKGNIDNIVYVSCNPATLARDVGLLVGTLEYFNGEIKKSQKPNRYEIKCVQPFDMFAQTKHVETVVLLNKIHN